MLPETEKAREKSESACMHVREYQTKHDWHFEEESLPEKIDKGATDAIECDEKAKREYSTCRISIAILCYNA